MQKRNEVILAQIHTNRCSSYSIYRFGLDERCLRPPVNIGVVVTFGSSPISWQSKKQRTVALSSCEAEYMALAEAAKEIIYIRSLCSAMEMHQQSPTTLFCDNQGAIALMSERSKQHQRTKHIDVKYHFVREQKDIIIEYVNKKDNLADILTKSLSKLQHKHILQLLQIEGVC